MQTRLPSYSRSSHLECLLCEKSSVWRNRRESGVVKEEGVQIEDAYRSCRFRIGRFPLFHGPEALTSKPLSAISLYEGIGGAIRAIVKMNKELGTPADDKAAMKAARGK